MLTTRPQKSGANYARIWNRETDESPLRTYHARRRPRSWRQPSPTCRTSSSNGACATAIRRPRSAVERLIEQGCDRILIFPLYPQYSATTTATANDQLFRALMKMRQAPAVRTRAALLRRAGLYRRARHVRSSASLATLDFEPEVVLASYHGIPKAYFDKGDPYHCHCQKTTRLLRERLGWDEKKLITTFQSRFGAQEWLQPYTDKTVERLAKEGVKSIAVINPGFSVDCIETLEEIAAEAARRYSSMPAARISPISPASTTAPRAWTVIETLVRRELSGWV